MLGDDKNISDLLEIDTNHRNLKLKWTSRDYWILPSVLEASEYSKTIPEAVCLNFSNSPIVWSLCPSRRVYCSYSWKAFCSIRLCLVYCNVDRFLIFSKLYKKQFSPHITVFYPSENFCVLAVLFSFLIWITPFFSAFSSVFLKHHAFLKHFLVAVILSAYLQLP